MLTQPKQKGKARFKQDITPKKSLESWKSPMVITSTTFVRLRKSNVTFARKLAIFGGLVHKRVKRHRNPGPQEIVWVVVVMTAVQRRYVIYTLLELVVLKENHLLLRYNMKAKI